MNALLLLIALANTDGGVARGSIQFLSSEDSQGVVELDGRPFGLADVLPKGSLSLDDLRRVNDALAAGRCDDAKEVLDTRGTASAADDGLELLHGRTELCQGKNAEASRRFEALTSRSKYNLIAWGWRAAAARALKQPKKEKEYRDQCVKLGGAAATCDPARR